MDLEKNVENMNNEGNRRRQTSPPVCNLLSLYMTTCCSTAPTSILPTPRARWPIM